MYKRFERLGVDSGQLAILSQGAVYESGCSFPRTDGIVTVDFKTILISGRDFSVWTERLKALGKSANEAVEAGEAIRLSLSYDGVLPYTYEGCSAASLSHTRFGLVGDLKARKAQGFCIGTLHGDGGYALLQSERNPREFRMLLDDENDKLFSSDPGQERRGRISIDLKDANQLLVGDPCYQGDLGLSAAIPVADAKRLSIHVYRNYVDFFLS